MARIALLGSGASSVAVASYFAGLVEGSHEVDILDFGIFGDEESVDGLSSKRLKVAASNSLFTIPTLFRMSSNSGSPLGSAAFGGWAEAWGATIEPFSREELGEMGFDYSDFESSRLELAQRLPYFDSNPNSVKRKTSHFFSKLLSEKSINLHVEIKPSCLALNQLSIDSKSGCIQCGECLSGCRYGHIWKPSNEWPRILDKQGFRYFPGLWVESILEENAKILVRVNNVLEEEFIFKYDYVFCGLGPIQTAALMIRSGIIEKVTIKDSQMIMIPFFDKKLRKTGLPEDRIALSEGFLSSKTSHTKDFKHRFFAQLYFFSNSFEHAVLNKIQVFKILPRFLRIFFLQRIGVGMFFFDEEASGRIVVEQQNVGTKVTFDGTNVKKSALIRLAANSLKQVGLHTFPFLGIKSKVGESYHFGASFPFVADRFDNRSDVYGRPIGLERLSIVDASVLPRIASTPPTFNVMVNAFRIAKSVDLKILNEI